MKGSMSGANQIKCLKAHHCVMRKMAAAVGSKYPEEIASRLWAAAAGLASYLEWKDADQALSEALKLYPKIPQNQPKRFALLCHLIGPRFGFRLRERAIRFFKPQLRLRTA